MMFAKLFVAVSLALLCLSNFAACQCEGEVHETSPSQPVDDDTDDDGDGIFDDDTDHADDDGNDDQADDDGDDDQSDDDVDDDTNDGIDVEAEECPPTVADADWSFAYQFGEAAGYQGGYDMVVLPSGHAVIAAVKSDHLYRFDKNLDGEWVPRCIRTWTDAPRLAVSPGGDLHILARDEETGTMIHGTWVDDDWVFENVGLSMYAPDLVVDETNALHVVYQEALDSRKLHYATSAGGAWSDEILPADTFVYISTSCSGVITLDSYGEPVIVSNISYPRLYRRVDGSWQTSGVPMADVVDIKTADDGSLWAVGMRYRFEWYPAWPAPIPIAFSRVNLAQLTQAWEDAWTSEWEFTTGDPDTNYGDTEPNHDVLVLDDAGAVHFWQRTILDGMTAPVSYVTNKSGSWVQSHVLDLDDGYTPILGVTPSGTAKMAMFDGWDVQFIFSTETSGGFETSLVSPRKDIVYDQLFGVAPGGAAYLIGHDAAASSDGPTLYRWLNDHWDRRILTIPGLSEWSSRSDLAVDDSGKAHVVVVDPTNETLGETVINPDGTDSTTMLNTTAYGLGAIPRITTDTDGFSHIVFQNSNDETKYATNATGTWTTQVVDSMEPHSLSVAVDPNGAAHVFVIGRTPSYTMKYLTNAGGTWATLWSADNGAKYLHTKIGIGHGGEPELVRLDRDTDEITRSRWNGTDWVSETLADDAQNTQISSIAQDPDGYWVVAYRAHDGGARLLRESSAGWDSEVLVSPFHEVFEIHYSQAADGYERAMIHMHNGDWLGEPVYLSR